MNFDQWHDKQLDGDPDTCPHKNWERMAWNAALEEAAKVAEKELMHMPALAQEVRDQIRQLKTKE